VILELHVLQSFPVSNLNRDDVGQPKTATFGGVTRARVSSQSWKRAARLLMPTLGLGTDEVGLRTKRLRDAASKILVSGGRDDAEAVQVTETALGELGFPVQDTGLTQYLLFVGGTAVTALAAYCEGHWDRLLAAAAPKAKKADKKKPTADAVQQARQILDARRAADVALFGRMIADNKDFNVDAASQVAHAISTHAVANEFDYYTAIDDLLPNEQSGADMIGTIDFNSAVYYRYANLNLDQLSYNLAGDEDLIHRTTRAWLQAFIRAVPSGKQNSMAARTPPSTLLGVVRDHDCWNLANAFLAPVTGADLITESTTRLLTHFTQLRDFYGATGVRAVTAASPSGYLPGIPDTDIAATCDTFTERLLTAATTA
jgi:CRISPR system Cascade subunit CasC